MSVNQKRIDAIRKALTALQPERLEIIDESHLHAGHLGAKSGKGHFKLLIRSPFLANKRRLQQHQMIYQCLGELMQSDIHALSIDCDNE